MHSCSISEVRIGVLVELMPICACAGVRADDVGAIHVGIVDRVEGGRAGERHSNGLRAGPFTDPGLGKEPGSMSSDTLPVADRRYFDGACVIQMPTLPVVRLQRTTRVVEVEAARLGMVLVGVHATLLTGLQDKVWGPVTGCRLEIRGYRLSPCSHSTQTRCYLPSWDTI